MCGIVGALVFKDSAFQLSQSYLSTMRDAMEHRGPDGAGLWMDQDRRVGFGHRRLSIIDLSTAANQPMSNEDGTLWVTFNGEIYNHAEIRKELEKTGRHRWKTDHSDTEVILHAFEEWGIECVQRFRGMFAIALWDAKEKDLWLIRDRVGIKPLYYSIHHGRIVFASEIKALLKDPEQKRGMHDTALYHYLSFLTTPAPQTLFDGILKLPAGTWLKVSQDGRVHEKRYWDVWDHTTPLTDASEDDVSQMVLEELRRAVKLRKVSDVPVGVFLSGGIDSSTNAALFSEGEDQKVKTFSIGYTENYPSYQSELPYARLMAEKIHSDHHEFLMSEDDLRRFLPQMVYLQDEPIADCVCVPVYYVSKLARDNGVIVCQVGEGADELFFGYQQWQSFVKIDGWNRLPVPRLFKKAALGAAALLGKDESFKYEWLRRGAENVPIFWSGAESFTEHTKKELLSEKFRANFAGYSSWEAIKPTFERFKQKAWDPSFFHWMAYADLNLRLPELLLMRVDKMTMAVSLEGRVPFLDHRFVELAMSIPSAMKTKNGQLKRVLKKAVRGLIPDAIIDRKKQGFGVPVAEWYKGALGAEMNKTIRQFVKDTDCFDGAAMERYLARGDGTGSWFLFNLALWWNRFLR